MKAHRYVVAACAVAVIGLTMACSKSSTGPSDPMVGTWSVTVKYLYQAIVADTGSVSPRPFTLTVAKSGTTYTATYPALAFDFVAGGIPVEDAFDSSVAGQGTLAISGDSIRISTPALNLAQCSLSILGAAAGGTAQGSVVVDGMGCPGNAHGVWTATKQ